jgi:hypothetical protein
MGSVFIFWSAHLPGAIWVAMCLSGGLVGVGILTFLLLQKHGRLGVLMRSLTSCKLAGDKLRQAAQQTSDVDEALKTFYQEPVPGPGPGRLLARGRSFHWHSPDLVVL